MKKIIKIILIFILVFSNLSYSINNNKKLNIEEIKSINPKDRKFMVFWEKFVKIICSKKIDIKVLKINSVDILEDDDKKLEFDKFVKLRMKKVFDNIIKIKIKEKDSLDFYGSEMELRYFKKFEIKKLKNGIIKKVSLVKNNDAKDGNPEILELSFVETTDGYKFFGFRRYG